ncbi:MAG: porin family protein [Acidobacteria bacterium]|jgi:hypothetical protein|nr:porin family protein [Acidobacteriota bacterium]
MSRNVQAVVLVLFLVALAPAAALAGGNANFTIGLRALNDRHWEPAENQLMLGANVDWGMDNWPVHLAWGLNASADSQKGRYGDEMTAAFAELSFGALWLPLRDKSVRPYLGAGITSVAAQVDEEAKNDDQDFGFYANAGVYWRLGPRFNLGLDLRYGWGAEFALSFEEPKFDLTTAVDGDYFAYSLLLGFGWGN